MLRQNCSRITGGYELEGAATPDSASRLLVSAIISARDEATSISSVIHKIKESLSGVPHEIIVVNDGSRDGTGQVASRSGVILVSHQRNLGKGAAMKTGV